MTPTFTPAEARILDAMRQLTEAGYGCGYKRLAMHLVTMEPETVRDHVQRMAAKLPKNGFDPLQRVTFFALTNGSTP